MYIIVDQNLEVQKDVAIFNNFYTSLESAFIAAIKDVEQKGGKDIKTHNCPIDTIHYNTDERLSNNNSIGSMYGVSYNSHYGTYKCARIILELKSEQQ